MKKTIATVATAALIGLGGFGGLAGSASAADYNTVPSDPAVNAPSSVSAGKNIKLTFSVEQVGNVKATGKVIFVIKRKGGGYFLKKSSYYNGGKLTTFTGKLAKKGKYTVKAKFVPAPGSVYAGSKDLDGFKVG